MAAVPEQVEVDPEIAVVLAGAAALGGEFPPGVPNTAGNRAAFSKIKAEIAAMPPGVMPDLPWDYAGD